MSNVVSIPVLVVILAGGLETFKASPKAPGKELLSRMTNVPGDLSFSIFIAKYKSIFKQFVTVYYPQLISNKQRSSPSSLDIVGLYQYFDVSFTKTGWWWTTSIGSAIKTRMKAELTARYNDRWGGRERGRMCECQCWVEEKPVELSLNGNSILT